MSKTYGEAVDWAMLVNPVCPHDRKIGDWTAAVIDEINKLLNSEDVVLLDIVMHQLEPEEIGPEISVAYLRTTLIMREHISCWNEFYNRVKADLIRRGLPSDTILRGLFA